jgi:YHS domain-containing protein
MILATIAATLFMGVPSFVDDPVKCAVMGSPTNANSKAVDYAGARFPFCCGGCPQAFMKEPTKYLKMAAGDDYKGVIGTFMFDPIDGTKLDLEKVKASIDFKGLRYAFSNEDDMKAFKSDPAKYVKIPEKESLVCPVSGEKIANYASAGGFMDYEGVRYYTCCGDCLPALRKDPAGVLAKGKAVVTAPTAAPAPAKKDGK